jgi:hypothetical protein
MKSIIIFFISYGLFSEISLTPQTNDFHTTYLKLRDFAMKQYLATSQTRNSISRQHMSCTTWSKFT